MYLGHEHKTRFRYLLGALFKIFIEHPIIFIGEFTPTLPARISRQRRIFNSVLHFF